MSVTIQRKLLDRMIGRSTSDGDGVKITRVFGGERTPERFDPFLMLDEFGSDEAADYIGGFPSHPHRGFETVTYMLKGRMLHEDHMGNRGLLEPGGVQWMSAGKGIIHSEMPQQDSGEMRGFQLWVNLPAAEKMAPASYQDLAPSSITQHLLPGGGLIKVMAGNVAIDGIELSGPIQGKTTQPLYLDIHLQPNQTVQVPVPTRLNTLLYVYEGSTAVEAGADTATLDTTQLGLLDRGDSVALLAGSHGARLLLIAGKPLGEPVVQYGPFVMNSREEIEQAMHDYRSGRLV